MNEKEEISKGKIVEPIFDEPIFDETQYGIMAPPPEHGKGVPYEAATMPAELVAEGLVPAGAPTTNHYSELMRELSYYNYRGAGLLRHLHYTTFASGVLVQTNLTVPGVWEVGETANYYVKVCNYTCFDLKDIKAYLYIKNDGEAKIISPPGSYLAMGDIDHGSCKGTTFKVKGEKGGDVSLCLRIDGYIGSYKCRIYYAGWYWNGKSWIIKHPYCVKYHIYG